MTMLSNEQRRLQTEPRQTNFILTIFMSDNVLLAGAQA